MKYALILLLSALPCHAQLKDEASARAALASQSARERLDAINYLLALRTGPAYEALAGHFGAERDAYLRVQLVEGLDVNASTWAYACAGRAASDSVPQVRQAAAAALAARAGDQETEAALKALAADPAEPVRAAVVSALAARPSPSAAAIVGGILSDDKSPQTVRRHAAKALAGMRTREADAELLKHAADKDKEVKAAAASRKPAPRKASPKKAVPAKAPAKKSP